MDIIISKSPIDYNFSQQFLNQSTNENKEFIWILQHKAVFTFGKSFENSEIPNFIHNIPCERSNRGGQITLHNEGQVIIYFCLNIKKFFKSKKQEFNLDFILTLFENIIIKILAKYEINAFTDNKINRGVFIKNKSEEIEKIAFIGINFKKNFLLNGISINFNNDLTPFSFINPCGLNCKISSVEKIYNEKKINKDLKIEDFILELKEILSLL